MDNRVLVTIAIPAYKPNFISCAIESALNQTYRNIEVLVVDDCSPFNIKTIVDSFSDNRIFYFRNSVNLGKDDPANNWNECLRLSKGEYFALLCDDDLYSPNFIEEMLSLARKYPNTGVFRSRAKLIDSEGKLLNFYPSSPEYESAINYMIDMGNSVRKQTISEFMYRTDFLRQHGGYANLPKAMCADHLTIYRLGMHGGIASSISPLVSFRSSDINLSGHGQDSSCIKEKLLANNLFVKQVENLTIGIDKELRDLIVAKHKEKFYKANIIVMSCAKCSDYFFLLFHKSKYGLSNSLFIKALLIKFKKMIKGLF